MAERTAPHRLPVKYRHDLDELTVRGCQIPDCTNHHHEMFLHASCHPVAQLEVSYHMGGILILSCGECHAVVSRIAVAEG
jgi:hypothetical protein